MILTNSVTRFTSCKSTLGRFFKLYSTKKKFEQLKPDRIRNIGILAHIDAGKTTTTERMLYYSGLINQIGEVHHGNTVTDYMEQERERGITITSASVSFYWKNNQFNLIDTPGHIDFTMEVEQTLSVLDGAVVILDGSAGVEAQTLTVWRQAEKFCVPRMIFVNKMDRPNANYDLSCNSIEDKFQIPALRLQQPLFDKNAFVGIIDILTMEKIIYKKGDLHFIVRQELSQETDLVLWEKALKARSQLIDILSTFNDNLANLVITSESYDKVTTSHIVKALREVTLQQKAVPVLMGSSYKNIGVQPLMDAVILYLPSPSDDRNKHYQLFEANLCARAFKVRHDKQRGPLVFFRIYSGKMSKSQKIFSVQQNITEQIGRLYIAYADEYQEVDQVFSGNIVVVSGLKHIKSSDLVTNSASVSQKTKNKMLKLIRKNNEDLTEHLFSDGSQIPEPVFFCSIESPSLAYQNALEHALNELQREDPSLRVTNDPETGQTVLSGMGELHLEIIKDRILREYKIKADLGPLQIAYLEAPKLTVKDSVYVDTKIGNSKQVLNMKLSLIPTNTAVDHFDVMKLDKSSDAASNLANIFPKHLLAIKHGIEIGLAHGPKIACRVINSEIMLHFFEVGRGTSESFIAATTTQLVQKLLKQSDTNVLEPIMQMEITITEDYMSAIMADLSKRRSDMGNVSLRGNMKVINVKVPLSELVGYSTVLRTITSGTATFTMAFHEYKIMSISEEGFAIKSVRGF